MKGEFFEAVKQLAKEKGIDEEVLFEAINAALTSAYKKNYGTSQNVRIDIERELGEIKVIARKDVVEEVQDELLQISLEDAKKINSVYEIGDIVEFEVTPSNFGRIAAQNAKQVVVQRIREAERVLVYEKYAERKDEIISGIVQRVDKNVFVNLNMTEGILPASEQIPGEKYRVNDKILVYITDVKKTTKGPQIMLSRTHPGLVKRLFEKEVPEINMGDVLIKNISREAGYRTKIAVASYDEAIDPVGSCVGQRGIRVQQIVKQLKGEKIDIIRWSNDPAEYIASALSPSKVLTVRINKDEKSASVVVPDDQLSLAIGKEGQNARLAAKLTGWKIDIKSESQVREAETLTLMDDEGDLI